MGISDRGCIGRGTSNSPVEAIDAAISCLTVRDAFGTVGIATLRNLYIETWRFIRNRDGFVKTVVDDGTTWTKR